MKNSTLRKTVLCGILASLSLISFVIESLLPPLFIPGARIGISNVFILIILIVLNKKLAYLTLMVKTVLGSILIGNPSAIIYSLPAGIIALSIEIILLSFFNISIIAISVSGAVINSIIQNVIFCLITKCFGFFIYLPYLAVIGTVSGIIVGFAVYLIIKLLPHKLISIFSN